MATTFCDQNDVESILSEHAVVAYTDDNEDAVADIGKVNEAIERSAVLYMLPKLNERYRLSDLTGNDFLKWANATFAALEISRRRSMGVPDSLQQTAREYSLVLIDVKEGKATIPEQAESFDFSPTVSNFNVQRFQSAEPVRTRLPQSTGDKPGTRIRRKPNGNPAYRRST